ncbi:trichome birefringence 43 [Spatholobus suberectus]|nr:trichome birefringence 43 [Spatholobus suberectus]
MDRMKAFEEALRTWAAWVDATVDPTKVKVFFQGISPSHYNLRTCLCGDNSSSGDDNNNGGGGGNADNDGSGCGGTNGDRGSTDGSGCGGSGGDCGGTSGDRGGIVSGGGDIACDDSNSADGHDRGHGHVGGIDDGSGDEACGDGGNAGGRGSCSSSDGW